MKHRRQSDRLALTVIIALIMLLLAMTALALMWEPFRGFLTFWGYVVALLFS